MTPGRVVCLGIAVLDHVFEIDAVPTKPVKVTAHGFRTSGGGMAATAAVAAAALGGKVAYWGRVGDDAGGHYLLEAMKARGVAVDGVRVFPGGATATAAVMIDRAGERLLAAFIGSGLSADPEWLPVDALAGAGAVLADIRWTEGVRRLFKAAGERGIPRVLDADTGNPQALPELVAVADHVIFSEGGLAQLTGTAEPEAGLRAAAAQTRALVAVTLGGEGVRWLAGGAMSSLPGIAVTAIDTNGAGDVFHGAYALAIAEGREVTAAMRFANAAAALKCARGRGWDGLPDRAAVEALLADGPR